METPSLTRSGREQGRTVDGVGTGGDGVCVANGSMAVWTKLGRRLENAGGKKGQQSGSGLQESWTGPRSGTALPSRRIGPPGCARSGGVGVAVARVGGAMYVATMGRAVPVRGGERRRVVQAGVG